jgi:hypothetical protein
MNRPKAVDVSPLSDYFLLITFNNDEKRMFDVKPYLDFKPFNELRNPTIFNTVKPARVKRRMDSRARHLPR